MSIITEISIPLLVSNSGAFLTGTLGDWASSEQTCEISTPIFSCESTNYSFAASEKIQVFNDSNGVELHSWVGNANAWSNYDLSLSVNSCCAKQSSWLGNANSWNIHVVKEDDHNKSQITSDNPNSVQGNNNVEWNYFPFPIEEIVQISGNRDMTRYQKTYSFSRHQPVRIRLYRT